jgi:hypothetical protein
MVTGTRVRGQISPAQDIVTGEELRLEHVWAGGRTCLAKVSGIRSKLWICLIPLGILVDAYDSRICTSPAHPIYPP